VSDCEIRPEAIVGAEPIIRRLAIQSAIAAIQTRDVDEMSHAIHVLIDRLEQVDAGWETAVGRARHHFAVGLSLWGVGS